MPPLARALRARAPEVELHLLESHLPSLLLEGLTRGELDLVLAVIAGEPEGLRATELLLDPYVLLVPAGDPLVHLERPVVADDLAGRELIGKDVTTAGQQALERTLEQLGVDTTTSVRAHDAVTVHRLVACGLGIAVIPSLLHDRRDRSVHAVALGHLVPDRRIGVVARDDAFRAPAVGLSEELLVELAAGGATRGRRLP